MYHCKQCRADAIGKLDSDISLDFRENEAKSKAVVLAAPKGLRFAITSKGGMLVDQHFGQASELYIYDYLDDEVRFKEKRVIGNYCSGEEECDEKEDKIGTILKALNDCDGAITMRIGDLPTKRLESKGIKVFSTYDRIEDAVKTAAQEILRSELSKSQELLNVSGGI
jgi:predicted Fe-Mo cluster-binding NifX family protein